MKNINFILKIKRIKSIMFIIHVSYIFINEDYAAGHLEYCKINFNFGNHLIKRYMLPKVIMLKK